MLTNMTALFYMNTYIILINFPAIIVMVMRHSLQPIKNKYIKKTYPFKNTRDFYDYALNRFTILSARSSITVLYGLAASILS